MGSKVQFEWNGKKYEAPAEEFYKKNRVVLPDKTVLSVTWAKDDPIEVGDIWVRASASQTAPLKSVNAVATAYGAVVATEVQ